MYEDKTSWPLKCPDCLHEFEENVGRLKASSEIRCPGCEATLRYEPNEFLRILNLPRRGLYELSQTYECTRARGHPRLKLHRQASKIEK